VPLSVLLAISILFTSAVKLRGDVQPVHFVGCISEIPNGGLQFDASRSGTIYLLQGATAQLLQHVNQRVRILATSTNANGNQGSPVLTVQTIDFVNDSCVSPLASVNPAPIVGKVGEGQVAVPLTTTASLGETTPGFQTETISDQEPMSGHSAPQQSHRASAMDGPRNTSQTAQSAASADIYAEAATRSEIQPGNTLGANLPALGSAAERTRQSICGGAKGEQEREFSPAR
jgi:hypothetical protein